MIWSDEPRFNLFHSDGKMKVWRQSNEQLNKDCILKTIQGSGGSILIWACFVNLTLDPCYIIDKSINTTTYINENYIPFILLFTSHS